MRVLLVYPLFPTSFWSFEKNLELLGYKALLPPLSLITVAALLPQSWEFRLKDRNIGDEITAADWEWADLVAVSGMIVQKPDMLALIQEAKQRGKSVVAGGPYATSLSEEVLAAGADFLVLDEGEITLPLFVAALEQGATEGIFRADGQRPELILTPVPRYDLLELDAYGQMAVQFSRGCPFQCEFCDIIILYGRVPRTKTPTQVKAELQALYDLGWRRMVFIVDDNFIGNKSNVKNLLQEIEPWMEEHNYPFGLITEASVDLAEEDELLELMVATNFRAVFLGIETPDTESLLLTKKHQNMRRPLVETVQKINQAGLRIMAGLIIGFDQEEAGAGQRIVDFVEATSIPLPLVTMLQALPNTALWHRLEKEGRLLQELEGDINQTTLSNFIPTRPIEEIAEEYIACFWHLYEPKRYLQRAYQHYVQMRPNPRGGKKPWQLQWVEVRALLIVCWRQGIQRDTRIQFWRQLGVLLWKNPKVWPNYLVTCAMLEHFMDYRQVSREEIKAQLARFPGQQAVK